MSCLVLASIQKCQIAHMLRILRVLGIASNPVPIIPRAKIISDICPAPGKDLTNGSKAFRSLAGSLDIG